MTILQIPTTDTLSMFELIQKGGWIMLPIILMSILSFYILFERILTLRAAKKSTQEHYTIIAQHVDNQRWDEARSYCSTATSPIALMADKALLLRNDSTRKEIEEQMESIGRLELLPLERGLTVLSVLASIAPMFGFLGTIIGVIKIFYDISMSGDVSIDVVSAGLYVKMVASAAGLMVGLIAFLFYNILNGMVHHLTILTERYALNLLEKTTTKR